MPQELWWVWMAAAAVLIVAEIIVPGFFFIWFGVGAAAAGIATILGVGITGQLVLLIVVSGVLLLFSRRIAKRLTRSHPSDVGADRLNRARGIVTEAIDSDLNTGMVSIEHEEWRATSAIGSPIAKGVQIEVVRKEGTHLVVRPVTEEMK
jgi:membrane protein implicated in regulation of membrane protease activity